jgi:deoxyribonuclease V
MILAVDVSYTENLAAVAGVVFRNWADHHAESEIISFVEVPAEYEPGQFYKRELPCILKLLRDHDLKPDCVIVDGFVYLDGKSLPGLGKHLFDALGGKVPVIGVAKKHYRGIGAEYEIYRGTSEKPLYITAAGMELEEAQAYISNMHGKHRIPALLKRADQLARRPL